MKTARWTCVCVCVCVCFRVMITQRAVYARPVCFVWWPCILSSVKIWSLIYSSWPAARSDIISMVACCSAFWDSLYFPSKNTLVVKSVEYDFLMFLKEASSAHQSCIYLIKNTVKIVKYYYNSKQMFSMWIHVIYFCDQSCIFSIITPVFSVTWSSEIILICWFAAQETFLIIINVEKNSCAAQYFCETVIHLFVRIHRWIESSKEQHLFEIDIFVTLLVSLLTLLINFNASLLNKSIVFFQNMGGGGCLEIRSLRKQHNVSVLF